MKLYYTISSKEGDIQEKPNLSLGGYKSGNFVNNSEFNNLFSDISQLSLSNYNQNRYIALFLVNESSNDAIDVCLYFEYPEDSYSIFKVAAVTPVTDSDGFKQIERVNTVFSKPLSAVFFEANGEINKVNLGNIDSGSMIGLWIERELKLDFIKDNQLTIYEEDPNLPTRYREKQLSKFDNIQIKISWEILD